MTETHLSLDLADRLELGARLRRLRERTGKTTLEVAEQVLGYQGSHAAVSRLERGVFASVNLDQLDKLATFYGTDRDALLSGTEGSDTARPSVLEKYTWGLRDVKPGVGGRIRDLRQAAGMRHSQFARAIGWGAEAAGHIRSWERGETCPRPDELFQIAAKFGVSGTWLILGLRAQAKEPTQPMRIRALRLLKGVSRPALALEAAPETFEIARRAVSHSENKGLAIPRDILEKLAKAFDVPTAFLDPQGVSEGVVRPNSLRSTADLGEAQVQYEAERLLPVTVRKLLEQIRTTAALGMLDDTDSAWLLKELSRRLWKKAPLAKAA